MNGLENLLLTYAGTMLINAVVSGLMWSQYRTPLFRTILFVWLASLGAFVVQGLSSESVPLVQIVAFSPAFLIGAALAQLIDDVIIVDIPWRLAIGVLIGSVALSAALTAAGQPFWLMALPVAIAVALPMVIVVARVAIGRRWGELSFAGRGLVVSICAFVVHVMDFPFLRDKPEYAAMGFSIAILIVFALSIFAPATALEIVAERTARVATELNVARHIQLEILPKAPSVSGLDLSCYMQPAEEVGGDYYDIYSFSGRSWLLLGDVTGHGLSSGLVMLMAQSVISAILHTRPDISPSELNFDANRILYRNLRRLNEQRTMTVVALCKAAEENRFLYSGSHEDLYVVRKDGSVEVIEVEKMPHGLGMLDEFPRDEYTEGSFALQPGDMLFISTDGVVEAPRNGDYNQGMYGEERLVELLKAHAGEPLDDVRDALLAELKTFTRGIFHDDISFVLARATG